MTTKKNEKTPEATAPETNERSPAFAIPDWSEGRRTTD